MNLCFYRHKDAYKISIVAIAIVCMARLMLDIHISPSGGIGIIGDALEEVVHKVENKRRARVY